jgi:hypothetical protein
MYVQTQTSPRTVQGSYVGRADVGTLVWMGSNEIMMNLDYLWQYLPHRDPLNMVDLVSVS